MAATPGLVSVKIARAWRELCGHSAAGRPKHVGRGFYGRVGEGLVRMGSVAGDFREDREDKRILVGLDRVEGLVVVGSMSDKSGVFGALLRTANESCNTSGC